MKLATFMIAAIATVAIGMGSAQAQDDGWHLNYTLNTNSQAATAQAQPRTAALITTASKDHAYGMTYAGG